MMFKHLEEEKQSELNYSLELTKQLEEPTKTLVENTFKKNIIAMAKNEKNKIKMKKRIDIYGFE